MFVTKTPKVRNETKCTETGAGGAQLDSVGSAHDVRDQRSRLTVRTFGKEPSGPLRTKNPLSLGMVLSILYHHCTAHNNPSAA